MHVVKHLHLQDRIATAFPRQTCEPPQYLHTNPEARRKQWLDTLFINGLGMQENDEI